MRISVAGTSLRPAMVGIVVDMPSPFLYLFRTACGNVFTVHDDEIYGFEVI